jgi:hypothetical protein
VFWLGNVMERDNLEDLSVGGRIILKCLQGVRWGGMDWVDLAPDRDRLWAVVNAVLNLRFP